MQSLTSTQKQQILDFHQTIEMTNNDDWISFIDKDFRYDINRVRDDKGVSLNVYVYNKETTDTSDYLYFECL